MARRMDLAVTVGELHVEQTDRPDKETAQGLAVPENDQRHPHSARDLRRWPSRRLSGGHPARRSC
ncbi:MAG: hypothetical protein M0C28_17430 [Candidatus Moduliflexus flocculans]|nr:hypothetical protein [Candidatus Moduliflexus flocculans]